jgi:phosphoglycerol transferase MdoB-like AlkP superfamily enzyme
MQQYLKILIAQIVKLFAFTQVFRILFYFMFLSNQEFKQGELLHSWYLGLKFDLRYTLIVLMPFALMVAIARNKVFTGILKKIASSYIIVIFIATLLLYLLDIGHYQYLEMRVNSSIIRFATNPLISLQMVWESYPVIWGTLVVIILVLGIIFITNKNFERCSEGNFKKETKLAFTGKLIISILIYAAGIYGAIAYYPLRWSQTMFTHNQNLQGFALNPGMNIYDTYKFKDTGFDLEATKKGFPQMAKYLGIKNTDTLDFRRPIKPVAQKVKPNIVVIMLESMGSSKMSLHQNPMHATPNMDTLAMHGRFFPNFFVPGLGTARTVYTSLTGIPDVSIQRTASRNQFIIDQRIIFNEFDGYEKYYFLGGNANWANIRAVFENNIEDLNIYEEGDYDRPHTDVWGLTDYDLFYEADKILKEKNKEGKPFIAYIQTASNHRPYTIGDSDNNEFKVLEEKDIDMKLFEGAAYDNLDQYNAVRYLDYNIGRFIKRAKDGGYLDNTIFVMFGDHDGSARPYNFNKTPWYQLGVNTHRSTMFIYGPSYVDPEIDSLPTTLMDVMPTMASYSGQEMTNYSLGQNLNDSLPQKRYSFMFMHRGTPFIAIFDGRYILKMTFYAKEYSLFDINNNDPLEDIYTKSKSDKNIVELQNMLGSYYASTKYLMFNNKKHKK